MRIARVKDKTGDITYAAEKDGKLFRINGDIYGQWSVDEASEVQASQWLSPVAPLTYLCVAANYRLHIEECDMQEPPLPKIFMKNSGCVAAHKEPIRIPSICDDEVDYEAELAVVIGKSCCNVSPEEVYDYILGYTAANDVSARIWQLEKGDGQWCRGKSFDTFGPLGPVLVTPDQIGDPDNLAIKTVLNGQVVQQSSTSNMIRTVGELVSFLAQDTTLLPGTVILTGTPEGVGWARDPKLMLKKGDVVSVEIENIGVLENPVE
jgi:2-keto-4-pentenoate hydratase/2-oxohepta-3-ene-1,7-dioic acid hydratase in catechol pathway